MSAITPRHTADYQEHRFLDTRKQRTEQPISHSGVLRNLFHQVVKILNHSEDDLEKRPIQPNLYPKKEHNHASLTFTMSDMRWRNHRQPGSLPGM